MLYRILCLLLLTALPLAAQTDTKEVAPDPLSAPLPEGVAMEAFTAWYGRTETQGLLTQFKDLGARNLQMKFENIRHSSQALPTRRPGSSN